MNDFSNRRIALGLATILMIGVVAFRVWVQATCTPGVGLCTGHISLFAQYTSVVAIVVFVGLWIREVICFPRSR